jgi:prepilin-type N-terminal cleavage/methylation domain-containing protein
LKTVRVFAGKTRGFTAVELVITVSIVAILAAVAIPGIVGGIQRSGVDGASRRLAEDIRLAQSSAISRGAQTRLIALDQTGTAPNPGSSPIADAAKANMYRIELRSGAMAPWPTLADTPASNANVVTVWNDLGRQYRSVAIATGNSLIFNSQGFLTNSAMSLSIVLQGSGGGKTVQTSVIGKATIQ